MSLEVSGIPLRQADRLQEQYRRALFEDMVPWWMEHSPDRECGGYYSCLERDGKPYAGDKFVWPLGRQVWMLSHLFNRHQARAEWRELAEHGARFMLDQAFAADGKMYFRLAREGKPLALCLSLYTECFAAIGLAELSQALGDRRMWDRAVQMYERIRLRLGQPTDTALLGYPINAEFHSHAHDMIRLTVAWVLNQISPQDRWEADIRASVDSILQKHWKPDLEALLENVAPDGRTMLDLPEGRMVCPGHAIESAWMMMEVARWQDDRDLIETALEITLASLDRGWDRQYGGLRYLLNLDGTPTHPLEADMKLWWPHGEALYALLLGWACTGREDVGRWYQKVHQYTFDHFPDSKHGEWYGYLNRDGSTTFTAKANGWKGFFRLPRILFRGFGHPPASRAADTPARGPSATQTDPGAMAARFPVWLLAGAVTYLVWPFVPPEQPVAIHLCVV